MTGGSFLDKSDGFQRWSAEVDVWENGAGSVAWEDLDAGRMVQQRANGMVMVHPDQDGSTEWFGQVLWPDDDGKE